MWQLRRWQNQRNVYPSHSAGDHNNVDGSETPLQTLTLAATERRIIALTAAGHALCHICELAYVALIPAVMLEFHLNASEAAALGVPAVVLFGVGAVPAGLWADRRGTQQALTVYFLLVTVAALSVYVSQTKWALCAALTLLGAAISIYHPVGLAMLSHGCRNRGRAMGINGVAGSLGVAIGPSMAIYMAAVHSWRMTYMAITALGVAGWLACLVFGVHVTPTPRAEKTNHTDTRTRVGILAILFLTMMVGGFNYRAITTALPTYLNGLEAEIGLRDHNQADQARESLASVAQVGSTSSTQRSPHSGGIVFLVFALGGIGQIVGGLLADRFRPAVVYAIFIAATVPCALLMTRIVEPAGIAVAATLAIFMFAEQPLENTMIAEATPGDWRSTIYGLKFILAFGIASVGMYAAGLVWEHEGLPRVFDMFALGGVVMALLAVWYAVKQRKLVVCG